MIASLPMYDPAPMRGVNDAFWAGIRTALGDGPQVLARGPDPWRDWRAADLVLSQTCALPWRARLDGAVTLVGAPDYGLPGCGPGQYNSVLVARRDEARPITALLGARVAINDPLSQSGYCVLWTWAVEAGVALNVAMVTGAHAAAARAVAAGTADLAAIDAQTWRLLCRHDPAAARLRVLARTPPTPALPFITARGRDPMPIRAAMNTALTGLTPLQRHDLGLRAIVPAQEAAMRAQAVPPAPLA